MTNVFPKFCSLSTGFFLQEGKLHEALEVLLSLEKQTRTVSLSYPLGCFFGYASRLTLVKAKSQAAHSENSSISNL